ncbi:MAG TPA: hypothetical protein VHI12_07160 [Gaiellaceae bacterium]|jgi:hypothetical protein|nr:hypothetical protein [Gaiellaceae bacterium]
MRLLMLGLVIALAAAGCGGGSDEQTAPLRTGVYEYELSEQYLLDSGISEHQAATESGAHTTTLSEDGTFVDSWRTAEGRTGSCRGTYEGGEGSRVTFKWTSGCFGDWEMSYAVEGDQVTWSDQQPLPPYESDEDQKVTEVFNSVPWTRVGNAS